MSDIVEKLNAVLLRLSSKKDYGTVSEAADEITHLREENARLRAAQEWHPMDEAPVDGTVILAVIDVYSSTTKKFLRSDMHVIRRDALGDAVTSEGDDVGWAWDDFKCWKPIVFPPVPEGGENV